MEVMEEVSHAYQSLRPNGYDPEPLAIQSKTDLMQNLQVKPSTELPHEILSEMACKTS